MKTIAGTPVWDEASTAWRMAKDDPYATFVAGKLAATPPTGLASIPELSGNLFPFQRDLVTWALRRGRCAIFADTGLGKTRMQLEWARVVHAATGQRVLFLAPLAVAQQTAAEGVKMGVHVSVSRDPMDSADQPFVITNYDRIHKYDASAYGAVVLDESSVIKHSGSKTFALLTETFARTPFKLCATATPSPNDYTELGTHAEFLGICTRAEMLAEFFCHDGGDTSQWRLKGHARKAFWRWVASWGALLRRPSDLGYSDEGYALPGLEVRQHVIASDAEKIRESGFLFAQEATDLMSRRAARRASLDARVAASVDLVMRCTCGGRSTRTIEDEKPRKTRSTGRSETCKRARTSKKDESTAQDTTGSTLKNTSSLPSDASAITPPAVEPMPLTLSFGPSSENPQQSGSERTQGNGRLRGSDASESQWQTETDCSQSKTADALSAETTQADQSIGEPASDDGSPSIIVIEPESSEVSSALLATSGSAASVTIQSDLNERPCTCAASDRWLVWVDLNDEQDALEKAFGSQCVSVYGSLDIDEKERRLTRYVNGGARILLTKPSILGFGLNLQFCHRMAFVGATDSWEAYYQAVRRCYRFGQTRMVEVDIFASDVEGSVIKNLLRKERDAKRMAEELSEETREAVKAEIGGVVRSVNPYTPGEIMVPEWLRTEVA